MCLADIQNRMDECVETSAGMYYNIILLQTWYYFIVILVNLIISVIERCHQLNLHKRLGTHKQQWQCS
jgi:hypothetical protein